MIQDWIGYLNLAGLISDIVGFSMLGSDLLKHPDNRRYWAGPYAVDLTGFAFVVAGFVLQALAQVISFL